MNNTSVESYLADGCGRCERYQTPDCKVHTWQAELVALRAILRATALDEHMKWGAPCYALDGKNVLMLSALNDFCAISFLKGAALDDPDGVLVPPGPNSRHARYLKFTALVDVEARRGQIEDFVRKAIAAERAGVTIGRAQMEALPDALAERLAASPELQAAFDALTPGRQRSHVIHVSGAKQDATQARRVEKCVPKIIAGKGFNER